MIIVEGVVCANGIADSDNDVLFKSDIKRLFVDHQQNSTDINHNFIQNTHDDVEVISSYISDTDKTIAGRVAPSGSWLAVMKIKNNELAKAIKNNELNGFSLCSIPKGELPYGAGIVKSENERGTYSQYLSMDALTPKFISIVDYPANGFGLDVMDKTEYILKSKAGNDAEKNTSRVSEEPFDVEVTTNDGGNEMSLLDKALEAINAVIKYEKVENSNLVKMEDGTLVHEANAEKYVEKHPERDEKQPKAKKAKKAVKKAEEEEPLAVEEEVIEETIDIEAKIAEIKKEIEAKIAEIKDEIESIKEEEKQDVSPKSEKVEDIDAPVEEPKDFYELTNRDVTTGRKLQ